MKIILRYCCLFFLLFSYLFSNAISNETKLEKAALFFQGISDNYLLNEDSNDVVFNEYVQFYLKKDSIHLLLKSLRIYSNYKRDNGKFKVADTLLRYSLPFYIIMNDYVNEAKTHEQLANILNQSGKFNEALIEAQRGYQILKDKNDTLSVAFGSILTRLGEIYRCLDDLKTAYFYFSSSLKISEINKNANNMAGALSSMSTIQQKQGMLDEALVNLFRAKKICEENKLEFGLSIILNNIGFTYKEKKEYLKSIDFYEKALAQKRKINHTTGIAYSLNELGEVYSFLGQYDKSLSFTHQAYQIAKEQGALNLLEDISNTLHRIYQNSGDFKNSLKYYEEYIEIKDSLHNDEKMRELGQLEANFEFEKEKVLYEKKEILQNAEIQKQKIELIVVLVVVLFLLVVMILIYRNYIQKRKANKLLEQQKFEIKEANEELSQTNEELAAQRDEIDRQKKIVELQRDDIVDSITYAQRIQNAILPPITLIEQFFPKNFVLYKPKDVVSGDFYWLEVIDDLIFIAVADCTGHGVPGALVSVVCHSALNRSIREFKLIQPSEILNKTRELVIETFSKSKEQVKDGMDISLCVWNKTTNILQYAGANNALYLLRDSANEIEIIKPDKQPVGYIENQKLFANHTIDLAGVSNIYLFTDGFADQFGGPANKKIGYKKLRELLVDSAKLSPFEQQHFLENYLDLWMENEDQIDDVCLMGIKL